MLNITLDKINNLNECCICLNEECERFKIIKFQCCNQLIHNKCIFDIVINGHDLCPLCRRNIELKKYFTRSKFIKYIYALPFNKKCRYADNIQKNLYKLTFFEYRERVNNNNSILNLNYLIYIFMRIINFMYINIISFFPYLLFTCMFSCIIFILYLNVSFDTELIINKKYTDNITILNFYY